MSPNFRLAVYDVDERALSALAAAVGAEGQRGCDPETERDRGLQLEPVLASFCPSRIAASVKAQAFLFLHGPISTGFSYSPTRSGLCSTTMDQSVNTVEVLQAVGSELCSGKHIFFLSLKERGGKK